MIDHIDARRATIRPTRDTPLGDCIRAWCRATHTSQSELGRRLGVDHSYVSRIAAGQRTPSYDMAVRLADEMGIDHADMALMVFEIEPQQFRAEIAAAVVDRLTEAIQHTLEAA